MKNLPLLLVFAFLYGCSPGADSDPSNGFSIENPYDGIWQDSPEVPFRFVLEQTFGADEEPEEEMLGGIRDVTTDEQGNVYIIDNQQNRLISFNESGVYRWSAGRQGEGPGEFSSPRSVLWDGNKSIYVGNLSDRRIEIFTTDGQYVDSVPAEVMDLTRASLVGFLDSDRLVVTERMSGRAGVRVHVVSTENEWTNLLSLEHDRSNELNMEGQPVSYSPYVGVARGELSIAHMSEYAFDFFSPQGDSVRVVSRDVKGFVRPGLARSGSGYTVRIYSGLNPPVEVAGGYYLVRANWPESVRDPDEYLQMELAQNSFEGLISYRTIDLYDSNWRLLYAWTLRDAVHGVVGSFFHTDSEGKLYARVRGDYPKVGRFRVEVSPPQ